MERVDEEFAPPATEYFKVIERLEKKLDGTSEDLTALEVDYERM